MSDHCEFCEAPAVRRIQPVGEAVRAVYGYRLACVRHLHWVRRLIHLDTGIKRFDERRMAEEGGER